MAYRYANPAATPEEFITNVGAQLVIAKQISPSAEVLATLNGQAGAGQPATTPPFQSAAGGGAVVPGASFDR